MSNRNSAGEVLTLYSGPQSVLLPFSRDLTYNKYIYPSTLQENTDIQKILYNFVKLATKLFLPFGASPDTCGFSCWMPRSVKEPLSPRIQREEIKFTGLKAALGDHFGPGAAVLVCYWGEDCSFLPSLFASSFQLSRVEANRIAQGVWVVDHTKPQGDFMKTH